MDNFTEETALENQNILPVQFFPRRRDSARMDPIRRLAMAVLVDAVHVFQVNLGATSHRRRRDFDEAREWLLGAPGGGPFALDNVCFLLDIDQSQLSKWLRSWEAMKRAGRPCAVLGRRTGIRMTGPISPRSRRQAVERSAKQASSRKTREPARLPAPLTA
jgi:hypothetical protein